MLEPYHKISTLEKIWLCWSCNHLLTFTQKIKCTYGYLRNAYRKSHGLDILPIL